MRCKECGFLIIEEAKFCENCGSPVNELNIHKAQTAVIQNEYQKNDIIEKQYINQPNPTNKNNKAKYILIISLILIITIVFAIFIINKNKYFESQDKEETNVINSSSLVSNTTWIASDESEVIFTSERIDWYQNEYNHTDNYYSGEYKFYIGKDAVKYITEELDQYGVTKEELEDLFDRNENYSENNFVVFDIRYDEFVLDGEKQTITRPLVPWYGFLLEENTFLDVSNMNTGTYYKFTKK